MAREEKSLGKKYFDFWREQPHAEKAIIALTGPAWGPLMMVGGVGATGVGFVCLVGSTMLSCVCCVCDPTCVTLGTDLVEKSAWLTKSGVSLIGLGFASAVTGPFVAIVEAGRGVAECCHPEDDNARRPILA